MSDFGDAATSLQERMLTEALKRQGIKPREIVIPPPTYVAAPPPEKEKADA